MKNNNQTAKRLKDLVMKDFYFFRFCGDRCKRKKW